MKLVFGIVSLTLFFSVGFSQNQTDSKGRKQGDWIKYYPNGKTPEYKGKFIDDKPTGLFYYYAPDGGVTMIADHNVQTGRSAVYFYHDDKAVKCFGIYKNQKKDSVWTYYSNTGIISKRETYKNGLLNGTVYSYFVNNMTKASPQKVVEATPYINGKKEGVEKEYFIDGTLKKEATYKNDKLNGWYKQYLPSGSLDFEVYYFNNAKHGFATVYVGGKKEYTYYVYGVKKTPEEYKAWKENCQAQNIKTNLPVSK